MLIEPLFAHARHQPQDLAIIDDQGRHTYGELAEKSAALGALIAARTNRHGIGLLLPSGIGFVASFYGALLAGKTVTPINFLLGDKEIAHCVADSAIDTILTITPLAGRVKDLPVNVIDLLQLPAPASPVALPSAMPQRRADDLAVLMYTSGTSGLPKGVPLTYRNLQSDVDAAIAHVNLERRHVFLGIVPLFHAFGLTATMLVPIQLGTTVVYMARFSPVAVLNAIREHNVSLVFGVPSMFAAMLRLKSASAEDFKQMYAILSGGEPLPAALREAFFARFGVHLYEAYGMTETSLAIALNTPTSHKPGSVGRPIPGMTLQITCENGLPAAHGDEGEIWVKGPMVMQGYHNLPAETAAAITPDGFFKTGDLGKVDADGFVFITGRKKDLIIVAGEKAAPREIEDVLMAHPAVAEAAVVGKKDPTRGEVVVAFVIPREGQSVTPDALREFCRSHGLAQWKVPREIQIVADFPRSPTGKVLKRTLAAQAEAGHE